MKGGGWGQMVGDELNWMKGGEYWIRVTDICSLC